MIDTSGVEHQLGASISQTISAGDSFGVSMVGSTITIYYKVGAGAWTALTTRTDTTYTGAGSIAFDMGDSATRPGRVTNFGGGTFVPAASPILQDLAHTPQHQAILAM